MEELARKITSDVQHAAEIAAALLLALATLEASIEYCKSLFSGSSSQQIRIQFGSSVAIALELLLGADVLATAVAPTWNDIAQLAAIAAIRTCLNYFLGKELHHVKPVNTIGQSPRKAA